MKSVRAGTDRWLLIIWKNGAESAVDVRSHIDAYKIFAPLQYDDTAFKDVHLGEWGWCAQWSNDMEISSDTLWALTLDQGSAWLRSWRDGHQITQTEAATALGVSTRMWRYYEAGTHLLPKTVRLACAGFDAQAETVRNRALRPTSA